MEEKKIAFVDKRRIKSVDDVCDDSDAPDLERLPTYVEHIQSKMEKDDKRLKEYITAHKERMAEVEKTRKRLEGEVDKRADDRFGELVADLIPVIDNIDRAIESAGESDAPLLDGVRLLRNGLLGALKSKGLELTSELGKPFDPQVAQAVATEPVTDESKDNVVLAQLAPGYKYKERLLRPAMVRVGRKVD